LSPAFRLVLAAFLLSIAQIAGISSARAQEGEALFLIAHPALRDADYRESVLIVTAAPSGGHVGVILNRPTRRSLGSLFPEHAPSKQVIDPVYFGGPMSSGALVALVRGKAKAGEGSVPVTDDLYLAFRASAIDRVIETEPNSARYFVGYVGWRPGELKEEIDRGLWSVLDADPDIVFRKNTERLWEDLLRQTRRLRAGAPAHRAGALAFSPQASVV